MISVFCYKLTAIRAPLKTFKTYGVINYCSDWRKDVVNQCLEFGPNTVVKINKIIICLEHYLSVDQLKVFTLKNCACFVLSY